MRIKNICYYIWKLRINKKKRKTYSEAKTIYKLLFLVPDNTHDLSIKLE